MTTQPQPAFTTERLLARDWREDEVERHFDMYSRDEVVRFLGSAPNPVATVDESRDRIARRAAYNAAQRERGLPFGSWAVVVAGTGQVAGTVALVPVDGAEGPDAPVEVAWHLHPDSWGSGYATEAARGAFRRGHAAGHAQILALTDPANAASIAVCRRLGLELVETSDRFYGRVLLVWCSGRTPDSLP